ncbi:MAG: hypothetical protein HZC26_03770 [Candidatus Magasanikbacteria bacterium]|nr:hypothetical protein [Candidatus Magasanikbacteria bacterium]
MNKLRDLVRAVWLLAIFALGMVVAFVLDIIDWICVPAPPSNGEDIITPLEDGQVPEHLQPIVAIRREAALVKDYRGPIAWYFRGNVTFAKLVAEFGHARVLRKIFGQQTDGIWPNQPMIVFWSPWEVLTERGDGQLSVLKKDWGLPNNHEVSRGRVLVLYLLLLCHHRFTGQSALPSGHWLQTETFRDGYQAHIGYGVWTGYRINLRGGVDATSYYMLGIEPAHNFFFKQAA